jgi:hypothetical protein
MKLTYWYAECLRDSEVYSIRERTRKEALAQREERGTENYGPVTKVSIEYDDGFSLMQECMGEGRGWWEFASTEESVQ